MSKIAGEIEEISNINSRNGSSTIEKTLHQLLTQANDHFGSVKDFSNLLENSEELPHVLSNHNNNISNIHNNNNNSHSHINHSSSSNNNNSHSNPNNASNEADLERAIESAIGKMDSHGILDSDFNKNNSSKNNSSDKDHNILSSSAYSIENILGDEQNTNMVFELDELDFTTATDTNINYNNNNTHTDNTINTSNSSSENKKRNREEEQEFEGFETFTKKLLGNNDSESKEIANKFSKEPFLSPASLSPTSSSENNDSQIKIDTISAQNVIQQGQPISVSQRFKLQNLTNDISSKKMVCNTITKQNKQSPYYQDVVAPEKLTNQYTMHQVSEMKKRIINTHKLMLNFNLLKDSYAKTCIDLKKSLISLKDSEIHRAHLLMENKNLKRELVNARLSMNNNNINIHNKDITNFPN